MFNSSHTDIDKANAEIDRLRAVLLEVDNSLMGQDSGDFTVSQSSLPAINKMHLELCLPLEAFMNHDGDEFEVDGFYRDDCPDGVDYCEWINEHLEKLAEEHKSLIFSQK